MELKSIKNSYPILYKTNFPSHNNTVSEVINMSKNQTPNTQDKNNYAPENRKQQCPTNKKQNQPQNKKPSEDFR